MPYEYMHSRAGVCMDLTVTVPNMLQGQPCRLTIASSAEAPRWCVTLAQQPWSMRTRLDGRSDDDLCSDATVRPC